MNKLKKCSKCHIYTLKNKCLKCNKKTSDAHYEFSNIRNAPKSNIKYISQNNK